MCEILIKASDNIGTSLEGDVVYFAEDGHSWGREESKLQWLSEGRDLVEWPNHFFILKVPNTTVAQANMFIENKFPNFTGTVHLDKTSIPQNKLKDFKNYGEATVSAPNLINYLKKR